MFERVRRDDVIGGEALMECALECALASLPPETGEKVERECLSGVLRDRLVGVARARMTAGDLAALTYEVLWRDRVEAAKLRHPEDPFDFCQWLVRRWRRRRGDDDE